MEYDLMELRHFGVKGMKWGVRNDKERSPRMGKKEKRQIRQAATQRLMDNPVDFGESKKNS